MRPALVKLEKWGIWIALIVILFLLRHMFPIFFLTFVLSYIANTAVTALTRRFPRRRLNVVLVYLVFLALLSGLLLLVVPRVINEARNVAREYIATESARQTGGESVVHREAREIVDSVIIGISGKQQFEEFRTSDAYGMIVGKIDGALETASRRVGPEVTVFANAALSFAFQFVLSIIISFILLWDLPATAARMRRYSEGRTAEIYAEITPSLRAFGRTLGRAFEAQSVVAIVNAVLSVVLFLLLGLPSIALLATIVFVCSYIPFAGMILSTIPAAFLAFKLGGFTHVLWLIVGIAVIHAVEAYLLNPLIYGRHLKLHPVAVLLILLVAEHLFGLWGLILGVPVAAFLLQYVLEGEPEIVPVAAG
ncbi:MAG TPA: AI-2E family transporter [Thermoanaerobaculia bacterium]|nr:AI-2E family transporter [Thermoanaerobaculia bacterium]